MTRASSRSLHFGRDDRFLWARADSRSLHFGRDDRFGVGSKRTSGACNFGEHLQTFFYSLPVGFAAEAYADCAGDFGVGGGEPFCAGDEDSASFALEFDVFVGAEAIGEGDPEVPAVGGGDHVEALEDGYGFGLAGCAFFALGLDDGG